MPHPHELSPGLGLNSGQPPQTTIGQAPSNVQAASPAATTQSQAAPASQPRKGLTDPGFTFKDNPIAAIGLIMSSFAAGAKGQPNPAVQVLQQRRKNAALQQQNETKQLTASIAALKDFVEIAGKAPPEKLAIFTQQFGLMTGFDPELLNSVVSDPDTLKNLESLQGLNPILLNGRTTDDLRGLPKDVNQMRLLQEQTDNLNMGHVQAWLNAMLPIFKNPEGLPPEVQQAIAGLPINEETGKPVFTVPQLVQIMDAIGNEELQLERHEIGTLQRRQEVLGLPFGIETEESLTARAVAEAKGTRADKASLLTLEKDGEKQTFLARDVEGVRRALEEGFVESKSPLVDVSTKTTDQALAKEIVQLRKDRVAARGFLELLEATAKQLRAGGADIISVSGSVSKGLASLAAQGKSLAGKADLDFFDMPEGLFTPPDGSTSEQAAAFQSNMESLTIALARAAEPQARALTADDFRRAARRLGKSGDPQQIFAAFSEVAKDLVRSLDISFDEFLQEPSGLVVPDFGLGELSDAEKKELELLRKEQ